MSEERFKLTIDRRVWLRGRSGSSLLRDDADEVTGAVLRQQCCVGIFLTALGVDDSVIRRAGSPDNNCIPPPQRARMQELAPWLFKPLTELDPDEIEMNISVRSSDCQELFHVNDTLRDEPVREEAIAEIFARHGVDVEYMH